MNRRRWIEAGWLSTIAAALLSLAIVPAVGIVTLLALGVLGVAAELLT